MGGPLGNLGLMREAEAWQPWVLLRALEVGAGSKVLWCSHSADLLGHQTSVGSSLAHSISSPGCGLLQLLWPWATKESASPSWRTPSWVKWEAGRLGGPDAEQASQVPTSLCPPPHIHPPFPISCPSGCGFQGLAQNQRLPVDCVTSSHSGIRSNPYQDSFRT